MFILDCVFEEYIASLPTILEPIDHERYSFPYLPSYQSHFLLSNPLLHTYLQIPRPHLLVPLSNTQVHYLHFSDE